MFEQLFEILAMPFMLRAIIGGIAICLCAALLGVCLVLKRYSMIGDGLSHVGFAAVAIATVLNLSPLGFAIPTVIVAAFILLFLNENSKTKGDAAIAILSTGALAIGVMAVSTSSGVNTDFNSFMFGSILGMSKDDVILSLIICAIVFILFILFYHKIFAITFDEDFSKSTGIKVAIYNGLLAVLSALIIVLGMRLMGALLISSLVIFPALTSMRLCRRFSTVIFCSGVVSVICFIVGVIISCLFNLPTGASVVCTNIIAFILFSCFGYILKR